MVEYFIRTPLFRASSKYWNRLNQKNIEQLSDFGYANFKQTVARNYFTFVGGLDTPYTHTLLTYANDIIVDVPMKEMLKKHPLFTLEESVMYNIITLLLFDYVTSRGGDRYIEMLEEPLEGNPPCLDLHGKRISQDVLNALLEYLSVSRGCDLEQTSRILELGAGSGRTSYCFLTLLPHVKYVIVDIPPALYISQTYLSHLFPEKKIFHFRPFDSFEAVAKEFHEADLVFFMNDQLALLPDKTIDLFLAIDCLHEMKREQVDHYFDQVERLAYHFYFKCWQQTTVRFDNITYSSDDYPIKSTWNEVYKQACDVPAAYFEAFYDIQAPK